MLIKPFLTAAVLATTLTLSPFSIAEKFPLNGSADGRIKTVVYNENDVVNVTTHYGFSSMIEFGENEEILTISIGDTVAWTFLETKNKLFIKPIEENANTNMQVVTSKRVYNFALVAENATSHRSSRLTFMLKFKYPKEELAAQALQLAKRKAEKEHPSFVIPEHTFKATDVNMDYTRRGSSVIAPIRVFDDGTFTYFSFNEKTPTPAIFAVDEQKNETLVNYHKTDKYLIVQRLAPQFTLRHGDDVTCVFNKKFLSGLKKSDLVEEPTITMQDNEV